MSDNVKAFMYTLWEWANIESEGKDYDQLRDLMDEIWSRMTPEEMRQAEEAAYRGPGG